MLTRRESEGGADFWQDDERREQYCRDWHENEPNHCMKPRDAIDAVECDPHSAIQALLGTNWVIPSGVSPNKPVSGENGI